MTADDEVGLADLVHDLIDRHEHERGPLLPVLHGVQGALGHIPPEVIPLIATGLNLSRADVYGVVTYYRDFTSEPAARMIRVCRAEACQAVGAEALAARASQRLGAAIGEVGPAPGGDAPGSAAPGSAASGGDAPGGAAPGGRVRLDEVFCLGNCALGPSVEADGVVYGRVTPDGLDALIAGSQR